MYRDENAALRARLLALETELGIARAEAARLKEALRGEPQRVSRKIDPRWRSIPGGEPTVVEVSNLSGRKIEVLWLSYEGKERSAGTLVPGGRIRAQTYVGHCWRLVDSNTGEVLSHTHVEARTSIEHRDATG